MKANAKAQFSELIDIAEYRDSEFWRKAKALVELPIIKLLLMAYSDNSGTGKVNHKKFKLARFCRA